MLLVPVLWPEIALTAERKGIPLWYQTVQDGTFANGPLQSCIALCWSEIPYSPGNSENYSEHYANCSGHIFLQNKKGLHNECYPVFQITNTAHRLNRVWQRKQIAKIHTDKQTRTPPPELQTITNHITLQQVKDTFSWLCLFLQHTNQEQGGQTRVNMWQPLVTLPNAMWKALRCNQEVCRRICIK